MGTIFGRQRDEANDPIDRAVAAWRAESTAAERLPSTVRRRIIQGAYEGTREVRVAGPLFRSIPRGLIATVVPALLAFAVVALYPDRTGDGMRHRANVRVGRAGDEVVFTIANGSRGHTVYKSNSSSDFRNAERVSVRDGSFRVQLHDEAELIFYRID